MSTAEPTVHIHQPTAWLGRAVRHCTTCRTRRRFVVAVYEYYPTRWTCGGCGHVFDGGTREYSGKQKRAIRRTWVAQQWPIVPRLIEAIRAMTRTFTKEVLP